MADIFNTKENRQLLYKYLVKDYIRLGNDLETAKLKAKNSMKKHKSNLWGKNGLAYRLGKRNLEFFCLYFLQDTFLGEGCAEIAPIHKEIWQDIETIIQKQNIEQQGYILPRGTGKSTFGTLSVSVWSAVYSLKRMIVICSSTSRLAKKFLNQVKETIYGNKYIEEAFGTLIDMKNREYKCNEETIQLLNNVCVEAYGSKTSLRGVKNEKTNARPDLIILDDYQDDDDVKTQQGRDNKWDRYSGDLKYAKQRTLYDKQGNIMHKGTTILAFGTIQHSDDFYMRLYNSPTWVFKKKKGVLVDDVDELFDTPLWIEFKKILSNTKIENPEDRIHEARRFYLEHKKEMDFPVLWESFWDKADLAQDYFENKAKFKQEVQGDLESLGQKRFDTIVTKPVSYIEDRTFSKCMLGIDPAGVEVKNKKKQDYFAFCVMGVDGEIKYVRKGELLKFDNSNLGYDQYIQHTLKLLKTFREVSTIYVEKQTYMGFDVQKMKECILKDEELKHRRLQWINESQHKNKDDKIMTIVPDVNMGRIIFNEEDKEFVEMIKDFSGCDYSIHDDAPDITAEIANRINDVYVPAKVEIKNRRRLLGI